MAYVINPDKGYIVNSNNFVGSSRMKYGYSQAFSFIHRKIRISELIEDVINSGKKITVDDMKDITFDILDVQMRESLYSMLHVAKHGTKGLYNFD